MADMIGALEMAFAEARELGVDATSWERVRASLTKAIPYAEIPSDLFARFAKT